MGHTGKDGRMMECSVIVPVYNCKTDALLRCIGRLSELDHERYEVIMIDDGSDIPVRSVLEENGPLSEEYMYCVRQDHLGVSAARNLGIELASGKRIVFCDADDLIDPDALDACVSGMADTTDFVCSGYTKQRNGHDEKVILEEGLSPAGYMKRLLCEPNLYGTAWGKIYSRECIQENRILFDPELTHSEDADFLLRYLSAAHTSADSVPFYTYRSDPASAAGKNRKAPESYLRAMHVFTERLRGTSLEKYACNFCCVSLLIMIVNFIFPEGVSFREGRNRLKKVLRDDIVRNALSGYVRKEMPAKNRLVLELLKRKMYRAVYAAAVIRRRF